MNVSVRIRHRVLLPVLLLLAVPCDAKAGFQWTSGWNWGVYGLGSIGHIEDKLDGVSIRNSSVWGAIGSSYPIHDVYYPSTSNALTMGRRFSLTDVDVDQFWRLELDVRVRVETEFSNFGSLQWYYYVGISGPLGTWRYIGPPGFHGSTLALNGDYTFGLNIFSNMSINSVPTPYSGYYKISIDTDFRTYAIPEPASWLMTGQGLFAAAGVMVVSKRRKPRCSRLRSTETHEILDPFETSGIKEVRS